ncbi:hypothetical protein [uncultured Jatrophihabitans sp.]|uniref:hypothetical protein n=1 Tax=uncultured Jatrophihabitans sp. TaxID=1610747 RepID=UPI0035CC0AFC
MTETTNKTLAELSARFGAPPQSFTFGDGIDWASQMSEVFLYVELPFWFMTPPGPVDVTWSGTQFRVEICSQWMEVFVNEVVDSRASVLHNGPYQDRWQPPERLAAELAALNPTLMTRPCKTMLRLTARAHDDAFRPLTRADAPRAEAEQDAYRASLCLAHVPVVNEPIQRYRLLTYDPIPYEVSAWDVPVWYIKHEGIGYTTLLSPYKQWDRRPVTVEDPVPPATQPRLQPFEWTVPAELTHAASEDSTPGELDLLDARSLLERGDYTGAVRRTVTAIETLLRWALMTELKKSYSPTDAEGRTAETDNDFPGRMRQWRKLATTAVTDAEIAEFDSTRTIRHEIVHRGRRITHAERGRAQRAVDTGRWLFNTIENLPDRTQLRDHGVIKSVGRTSLALRFPTELGHEGITVHSFGTSGADPQ